MICARVAPAKLRQNWPNCFQPTPETYFASTNLMSIGYISTSHFYAVSKLNSTMMPTHGTCFHWRSLLYKETRQCPEGSIILNDAPLGVLAVSYQWQEGSAQTDSIVESLKHGIATFIITDD